MTNLPWFRAYTEMVDDEKLRLLAFEDRWHFVALLCLKGQGVLDETGHLLFRKVAVKLGLDVRSVEEVARRLSEVGLIDEKTLQPIAWEARQFRSDSSAARVAAYRARKKQVVKRDGNVTVTAQDTDTDTDTDKEEEEEKTKKTAPRKRACRQPAVQCPDGVDQQVWNDWLALRKEKRASVTQTVIDGAMGEAEKAGMTFEDFLRVWCRRGTQGLEAAWLKPAERKAAATSRHNGFSTMNYNEGISDDGSFV